MAGLARGKIIYGDSSGDPAALAVGTANYILTSDGADIELDILKYVAYKMQHPAIEEIDIIIIPNEYENSELIKYINKLLDPSVFGYDVSKQTKELEKKDSIYLITILSVLLFVKTINIDN